MCLGFLQNSREMEYLKLQDTKKRKENNRQKKKKCSFNVLRI